MGAFPRTEVGGVSLSRMIVGTNWFLGFSHTTPAKDAFICQHVQDRKAIADILEVFFRAGVNTVMGMIECAPLAEAITEAEDRTGVPGIIVSTPALPTGPETLIDGFDPGVLAEILDRQAAQGVRICMPHQCSTDAMVDRCTGKIRKMDQVCAGIRERGMVPGLSTHMPETILYADDTGLDVETYIALYNATGFLMQLEVDWVARIIQGAKKPVMTIKPMAAGQIRPFQAMHFVWNTLRDQDMAAVGTMSPQEAAELIELSLGILEQREAAVALQRTRSKASIQA